MLSRYSNYNKSLRLIAWVHRIIAAALSRPSKDVKLTVKMILDKGELQVDELCRAEWAVTYASQRLYLTKEQLNSPVFKKLFPRVEDGLWCVGGRLKYTALAEEMKSQPVLPPESPIARQIIERAHNQVAHAGVDRTLMCVRATHWILSGRKIIKTCIGRCILCRKLKAGMEIQRMGTLPDERIMYGSRPFTCAGVDLFGPIIITMKGSSVKRWGVIFTCMACRGVHLDIAEDLTTSAFLCVLERFINRRGKPKKIRSDNGTNLVGARAMIQKVKEVTTDPNAPAASNQGGVWERLIRSVCTVLTVILCDEPVSEDKLRTTLSIAEGVINSRPLTLESDELTEMKPLTPNHFIQMEALDPLFKEHFSSEGLRRDWRQSQKLASMFQDRWAQQYLPELLKGSKWFEARKNVKVGELVLLNKTGFLWTQWPLARVVHIYPGRDGLVRNIRLKTKDGLLLRPVNKVVRLEADIT